jgi:hypothetical protein
MKTLIWSTLAILWAMVVASISYAQTSVFGVPNGTAYGPQLGAYPVAQAQFVTPTPGYQPVQLASHCDDAGCDSAPLAGAYCEVAGGGCDSSGGCGLLGGGCGLLGGGCGLLGGGCGLLGGGCGLLGGGCGEGGLFHGGGLAEACLYGPHGPFGDGGRCLPRWFDASAEWLYWQRDLEDSLVFSSEGVLGTPALSTDDLEIDEESAFRVSGAYLVAPAASLEASYFGLFDWSSSSVATSNGNLFSVFSGFGTIPPPAGTGFPESDRSDIHSVALSSELDSGELNLRHRWVSANCLVHSSWLVGARYVRVAEDLIYDTQGASGGMNYLLRTDNDLVGAQIGTDALIGITPRFKIGGEVEAGVYGTKGKQRTSVLSFRNSTGGIAPNPELREYETETDVAFVAEAGVMGLFRVTPRLTLKLGYQVLYVDGVALAIDNFNTASPFAARTSFIDNEGDVFYHGSNLGFEWTW